jgi:integrase/recombinase XerD
MAESQLFDANGERKYLTQGEAKTLLIVARRADPASRLFCELLYYSGCRCSEGLQITPRRIDTATGKVVFRTLKRRRAVYRGVPVPRRLLRELLAFANASAIGPDDRLFPWCRQTAWRRIRSLMDAAGIEGPQATPKGLRHQFGCHAIGQQVPEYRCGALARACEPQIHTCVHIRRWSRRTRACGTNVVNACLRLLAFTVKEIDRHAMEEGPIAGREAPIPDRWAGADAVSVMV